MQDKKVNRILVQVRNSFPHIEEVEAEEDWASSEYCCFHNGKHLFKLQKSRFQEILEIIYDSIDTKNLIAKDSLRVEINNFITAYLRNEIELNESTISDLLSAIENKFPKEEWSVFCNLYGAKLALNESIELGIYTIYQEEYYQKFIESHSIPNYISRLDSIPNQNQKKLIISVKVSACDAPTALRLANHKFHQFDNIIRYMISSWIGAWDVGIFDYVDTNWSTSICVSPTRYQSSSSLKGVIEIISLDTSFPGQIQTTNQDLQDTFSNQLFFKNKNLGYDWIWERISTSNSNTIQKRIISAIEWVGKSLRDNDLSRAFVQLVFALEVLFTFQETNVLVSPSIASQISEFTAFVLENDFDGRSRVEKAVKDIYSKRSGIAHGGNTIVSENEYKEALSLIRQLILKLTTQEELLRLTSINELKDWVKCKKFS